MKRSSEFGRPVLVSTLTAGVLMAVVACGAPAVSGGGGTPAAGSASRSAAADPSAAGSSEKARTSEVAAQELRNTGAGAGSATVQRCHTGALTARVGDVDAGAGQRYAPLVLTNTSAQACHLYGYPGLIMIDGKGDVLRTRTRRDGTRSLRITLRPGAAAHTRMHWTAVPAGNQKTCPASARLIVLAPDEVGTHLEIPFQAAPCDDGRIDVSPMAAGTR